MDILDATQLRTDAEEAAILRRARLDVGKSSFQCYTCFEIIPEKRRKAYPGVRLCVACQEKEEEKS